MQNCKNLSPSAQLPCIWGISLPAISCLPCGYFVNTRLGAQLGRASPYGSEVSSHGRYPNNYPWALSHRLTITRKRWSRWDTLTFVYPTDPIYYLKHNLAETSQYFSFYAGFWSSTGRLHISSTHKHEHVYYQQNHETDCPTPRATVRCATIVAGTHMVSRAAVKQPELTYCEP